MEAFAVTPAGHRTTGKFVHDNHLSVLDDIVHVALEQDVGLQGLIDVMQDFDLFQVEQAARIHQPRLLEALFHLGHTRFVQGGRPALLVHRQVLVFDLADSVLLGIG